jgi:hypothetical protein
MPSPKPPFPAQSGLCSKPTIINNVETLAHVSRILNEGPEVFHHIGTKDSPGTKTFALTGHVANTGLVEVPYGTPLLGENAADSEIILDSIVRSFSPEEVDEHQRSPARTTASSRWISASGPSTGCSSRETCF